MTTGRGGKDPNGGESVHLPGVLSRPGVGGGRGQLAAGARGGKNSPNPSLITMPAKSEILTAAAPHRVVERREEERREE